MCSFQARATYLIYMRLLMLVVRADRDTSYVPVRRLKQHLQWEQMIAYLPRI